MIKWKKIIRPSIFVNIIFIFIVAFIALIYISMTTHKKLFRESRFPQIMNNSVNYALYVVQDIGTPPDTLKAQELAETLGMEIFIENEELVWSHPADMKLVNPATLPYNEDPHVRAGFNKGLRIDIREEGIHYQLQLHSMRYSIPYAAELSRIIHITAYILLLLFIYVSLRYLLKPVGALHQAVCRMASGELGHEIPTRRRDELGQLVRSFNTMETRIRDMISAREQLLLDVSHELRSPLTRIKVSLEMMDACSEKEDILSDMNEMEAMINELLEEARIQSPHGGLNLKPVNLKSLVDETVAEFKNVKPGIKIMAFPDDVDIDLDRSRIKTLLKNVISNGLKYSPENGYPVEISMREKGDEIVISVQDFGSGIPEEDLPFVFEPFYRVDKSRSKKTGGYGLGMSLSKKIMEAHGGAIDLTSRVDMGTTVLIRFPR